MCSHMIRPTLVIAELDFVHIWAKLEVIKEDPADNKILECAVTAGSDYICDGRYGPASLESIRRNHQAGQPSWCRPEIRLLLLNSYI